MHDSESEDFEQEEGEMESVVFWYIAAAVLSAVAIIGSFCVGLSLGIRVGSGGGRSALGVVPGKAAQAAQENDSSPTSVPGASQGFGPGFSQEYDSAMNTVDAQVKRFLDSTVFGGGPRRARSGEAEDD